MASSPSAKLVGSTTIMTFDTITRPEDARYCLEHDGSTFAAFSSLLATRSVMTLLTWRMDEAGDGSLNFTSMSCSPSALLLP